MKTKQCSKCKRFKNVEDFSFANIKKNTRQSACKICKKNPEATARYDKKYRQSDKYNNDTPYRKEFLENYRKSEKGKKLDRIIKSRRRARKRNINENFSFEDQEYIMNLFNHKCFNCGNTELLEVDHHKPLSKGYALSRQNAVILCKSCNSSKNNKDPKDFYSTKQLAILEESYNII